MKTARISISTIITLAGLFFAGLFWVYTINGLPARVEEAITRTNENRERINALEKQLIKNDTKTDLILKTMYEIQTAIRDWHKNSK